MGDFISGGSSTDKIAGKALPLGTDSRTVLRAADLNDIKNHTAGWTNVTTWAYLKPSGVLGDGTDDKLAIQGALDSGIKNVRFPGIPLLTSGNEVRSGTHLKFEKGCVLTLIAGSNRPALQNANWQKAGWGGATYGLDSNISIDGLVLDGNGVAANRDDSSGQAHTGSGIYAGEYTSGIRFFGVTNLTIKNTTIRHARTYGVWVCSILNLTVRDLTFDQYMGGAPDNQDGLHINGPATNLDVRNLRGSTNDDMIGLNADDGAQGSNVTNGAITNVLVDGVYPVACLNGIRLLSANSRMDQITIRNVQGTTRDVAIQQSPYGFGPGNFGTLTIDGVDVQCSNGYAGGNYYSVIAFDGIMENVSVRNVKRSRAADNRPVILVTSGANIGNLDISGLNAFTPNGTPPANEQLITVNGIIDKLSVRNVMWARDVLLPANGCVLWINAAAGKGVTNLLASDWTVTRLTDVISITSGKLAGVTLSNIVDSSGLPGLSLLNLGSTAGAVPTGVSTSNCYTDPGRKLVRVTASSSLAPATAIDKAGLSGASAGFSINQSITAGSYQKLSLASIITDRLSEFDVVNYRFTASQGDGTYLIAYTLQLTIPTNPTDVAIRAYKNGSPWRYLPGGQRFIADAIAGGHVIVPLTAGDYVELYIWASNAITVQAGGVNSVACFERLK